MYELLIERHAERDLKQCDPPLFRRLTNAILTLQQNPRPAASQKLHGSAHNDWRLRVGDYRVVYEIDDDTHVVRIFRVKHRREVYR